MSAQLLLRGNGTIGEIFEAMHPQNIDGLHTDRSQNYGPEVLLDPKVEPIRTSPRSRSAD
jgi:hypothetical protein